MSTGPFTWHDLMTTDVAAAQAFYAALFGWDCTDEGGDGYVTIRVAQQPTGGMVAVGPDQGIPPHWMVYAAVEDCDDTCVRAVQLGGEVRYGPVDVPGFGRFAVVKDDQDAFLAVIARVDPPAPTPPGIGEFCWYTLVTRDADLAGAFYGGLFGWTLQRTDLGGGDVQPVFFQDGQKVAGVAVQAPENQTASLWTAAVAVDELSEVLVRAKQLGGTVLVPETPLGEVGTIAMIGDPSGAALTLLQRG